MRAFVAGLLLSVAIAFPATAADVTWTWLNPAANTAASGGGSIPATGAGSLTTARLEFGTCGAGGAFGTKAGETVVQAAAQRAVLTNLLPSTVCARVYVSNTYGSESTASNVASAVIAAPVPNAPTNLTTTSPTAYEIRTSGGQLVASRIGIVPLGTFCGTEAQSVDGVTYHRVQPSDTDLINWPSALANLRVWAVCG